MPSQRSALIPARRLLGLLLVLLGAAAVLLASPGQAEAGKKPSVEATNLAYEEASKTVRLIHSATFAEQVTAPNAGLHFIFFGARWCSHCRL